MCPRRGGPELDSQNGGRSSEDGIGGFWKQLVGRIRTEFGLICVGVLVLVDRILRAIAVRSDETVQFILLLVTLVIVCVFVVLVAFLYFKQRERRDYDERQDEAFKEEIRDLRKTIRGLTEKRDDDDFRE
jgi:Ca2+/Na+ antiporter